MNTNGFFNTISPKIYMFNRISNWTKQDWIDSRARCLLTEMFDYSRKIITFDGIPDGKPCGHYIDEDKNREWWNNLNVADRNEILSMPNFDAEIFEKITGIDVTAED